MGKETLGLTAKKEENFSEWYTQLIQKAELIEYTDVSGCYVLRPRSYQVWEAIQEFFNAKIKAIGVHNTSFPLFIPEANLIKEKEHVEGFSPEVAWVTHAGNTPLHEKLAVRPTSETIMYPAFSKWIRSYQDLPLRINQWCNVVRWEFKNPVPFLRSREFLWQEGHTAHATEESARNEVFTILDYYEEVYSQLLAIPGIKGRKTDREKFAGAVYTTTLEIILPGGKAIQGCTSHHLGQNFAKAFDVAFSDADERRQYAFQNSWGLSTRSIGTLIMMHSDNKGLVLPPRVVHNKVVIVPILFDDSKAQVLKAAESMKETLSLFHPLLDTRDGYTPGWKFNEWELKGVPLRIEIGPKDLLKKQVMLVRRDTGAKKSVEMSMIAKVVEEELILMQKDMLTKALLVQRESMAVAKNKKEYMAAMETKKIARIQWCGKNPCEDFLAETEGVKSLCIPLDEKPKGVCLFCEKPSVHELLVGRSY